MLEATLHGMTQSGLATLILRMDIGSGGEQELGYLSTVVLPGRVHDQRRDTVDVGVCLNISGIHIRPMCQKHFHRRGLVLGGPMQQLTAVAVDLIGFE